MHDDVRASFCVNNIAILITYSAAFHVDMSTRHSPIVVVALGKTTQMLGELGLVIIYCVML